MSVVRLGIMIAVVTLSAACAEGTTSASTALVQKAAAPTAVPTVAPAATPVATPTPAPAKVVQPPPQAPPPPATSTFALSGMGSGLVRVSSANGRTTITVSASGIAAGAHATHVHRGCDGSGAAHLFALFSIVGPSGSSTTTLQMARPAAGWTVIIYPGAAAVGRPILCATIS